ncbi:MAG TPA: glycosyltransferase, partial [Lacipirellulaceae bacterium]|nr:glycosyltransferase [Lacipirellulaceae bacterium]
AADLGVSDLIEWCGYCSNRDEMYGGLDCVLVPSTEPEPFGWVAVEPSCYGIPVITSDAGGLREIVQDGETGFQVSAGDVESLAERMSAICESRQLAARLATQAFEWNAARFGDESILNEFAALVRRVAEC